MVEAQQHFSIALPPGWRPLKVVEDGAGVVFAPRGGYPQVLVDFTSSPHKDAAADWRAIEPSVRQSSRNYHLLGIESIPWRGYPTAADWDFTRTENDGTHTHVKDRGFVVDSSHGYAIMVSLPVSQWGTPEGAALRDGFFTSFKSTH